MGCNYRIEDGSYDFFKDIAAYIKKAEKIFSNRPYAESSTCCTSFSNSYQSKNAEIAKDICEKFTKLYKSLSPSKDNPTSDINYQKDCGFLNFWINYKFRESEFNDTKCVKVFFERMKNNCENTFRVNTSLDFIYDMNDDDFNKMNKLYNLHEQISKIQKILIPGSEEEAKSSLSLPEKYLSAYREIRYNCTGKSSIFCESLENFKKLYEQLYEHAQRKGEPYSKYVIQLTEGNNNIILTPLLCSISGLIPLWGILYKFTPMGQILRSKNKKFTKEYSNNYDHPISLHQERYNIKYDSVEK